MVARAGNALQLTAGRARIFCITHVGNVPWVLDHGLHSRSAGVLDPNFHAIGNPDVIDKRTRRAVPVEPGGTLSDYIPFYFTPHSPMLLNLKTGRGVPAIRMPDIAILGASLRKLAANGVRFVFTDRHAYLETASYFSSLDGLDNVDWAIPQARSFRRDPNDPGRMERYQAEALVYRHLPVSLLEGIACFNAERQSMLQAEVAKRGLDLAVRAVPGWYF